MKIRTDEELFQEIIEEYNNDPEGWKVSAAKRGSRVDFYISRGGKFWHLKSEILTPYKRVGVGGKVRVAKKIDDEIHYGWRPLTKKQMRRVMRELKIEGTVSSSTLQEILQISPKSFFDIDEEYIFQGPITFHHTPLQNLSKNQKKLDIKLTKELNKLVFYNGGTMYR
jgi:hypothetical protein